MPTFKLTLAYDGGAYCGWQAQAGQTSVQESLEAALARITGETFRVVGSGRTDTGVHALAQVVSFNCNTQLDPASICCALNAELPHDIAALDVALVADDFHAIRSAKRKLYRYLLHDGPIPDVFLRNHSWHCRKLLDAGAMQRAAQALVGRHDFRAFASQPRLRKSSVRTVYRLTVRRRPSPASHRIEIEIEANGFLYNMARTIVGSLVMIGRGKRTEAWLGETLASGDRRQAGMNAPPQGLYLVRVDYD